MSQHALMGWLFGKKTAITKEINLRLQVGVTVQSTVGSRNVGNLRIVGLKNYANGSYSWEFRCGTVRANFTNIGKDPFYWLLGVLNQFPLSFIFPIFHPCQNNG